MALHDVTTRLCNSRPKHVYNASSRNRDYVAAINWDIEFRIPGFKKILQPNRNHLLISGSVGRLAGGLNLWNTALRRTRNGDLTSVVIRDPSRGRQYLEQCGWPDHLIDHGTIHGAYHRNRLAVPFFQENGDLGMRYQAIINQELRQSFLKLENRKAGHRDPAGNQGQTDVPSIANTNVTGKFRYIEDINMN